MDQTQTTSTHNKDLAIKAERARRRRIEEAVNGIPTTNKPKQLLPAAAKWMDENEARWSKSYNTIQKEALSILRQISSPSY
jgi:hypothetical protein